MTAFEKLSLEQYLDNLQAFLPAQLMDLKRFISLRQVNAGEIYIPVGSNSQKLAFIIKGLIRTYLLTPHGEERTLMLRWENQFFAAHDTILNGIPTRFAYQAMEDTLLLEMDHAKVVPVIEQNLELANFQNKVTLEMLAGAMERMEEFVLLTAEERYQRLITQKPDIYNRVPDKYLASMLGVTPVTLSRIRKRTLNGR